MNPFFLLYLDVASVVLNAALWVLDRYIEALDWFDTRLFKWHATHILHLGYLRIKVGRDFVFFYKASEDERLKGQ